ncbi:MAG TPA: peptidoglycan-associated lipoprotein Pal [Thermoanaerobaculia bacterium]
MTRRITVACTAMLFITFGGACRSRTKTTAPAVVPTTTVAEQSVPSPASEFRSAVPETREILRGSELTRVARERGWIRDAFFGFDSHTLEAEARAALDASARWLRDNPDVQVTIEGHCDERGTEQYNLALGERRANAAREYLAALGVGGSRLTHVSYGEEKPFEDGASEEAWQQNRRAHIRVER